MPEFRRRIDVMLEPSYLGGISERSIDDVRTMHDELLEVETEVSYVRRLAQARIDIVEAELARRERGGSLGELVDQLPAILSDTAPRGDASKSRLPRHLAPSMDIVWRRGLEHLISDATLVNLPTIEDDELRTTLEQLRELERETSGRRRELHNVIDAVEADLAARHKADLA
jgi:hypothetical protein